jgi:hypothetical protein
VSHQYLDVGVRSYKCEEFPLVAATHCHSNLSTPPTPHFAPKARISRTSDAMGIAALHPPTHFDFPTYANSP